MAKEMETDMLPDEQTWYPDFDSYFPEDPEEPEFEKTVEDLSEAREDAKVYPHAGHRARMRKRFREEGNFDHFKDEDVLEFLLFYGNSRSDTKTTAHELLTQFGSLKGVLEARPDQLSNIKGIGESQATLISMIRPLFRVYQRSLSQETRTLRNYRELEAYCKALLSGERTEKFMVICVSAKCQLLGTRCISTGSLSEVSAYPRLVMETALNYNAHSVFFCHNHPGGTAAPSGEDIASTRQLQRQLSGVGIQMLDHVIIAGDTAYSMMRHGDTEPLRG